MAKARDKKNAKSRNVSSDPARAPHAGAANASTISRKAAPVDAASAAATIDLPSARALFWGGWATIIAVLALWTFWYFPVLGHDYAAGVPYMFEMHDMWQRFDRLDADFSPARCLGLPLFSNANSLVFSVYHFFALFLSEVNGIFAAMTLFLSLGYLGVWRLARSLRLSEAWTAVLAIGWCLQGWTVTRVLPGHSGFLQMALLPLLLWIALHRRPSWWMWGTLAFWLAHLLYTSSIYILLTGLPALLVAAFFMDVYLDGEERDPALGGTRTLVRNLLCVAPLCVAMTLPRVLGVMNFAGKFPREIQFDQIALWKAFVYTLSHYVYPFPWDVHGFTGWWYGNWESYQFLFPGLVIWLGWCVARGYSQVPWRRVAWGFGALLVAGTVLSSGCLAPIFRLLPVLKSLHVNPRWNTFVWLPFLMMVFALVRRTPQVAQAKPGVLLSFAAAFVLIPFSFIDRENMQITYPYRAGLAVEQHRAAFCYEPVFGYGLENFPLRARVPQGQQINWLADVYADPRCYLKSHACTPGTLFGEPGSPAEDRAKLLDYTLRDDYAPVRDYKRISLAIYVMAFAIALGSIVPLVRELRE